MAVDVINSINGYITKVRGTATSFVRETVLNGVDETVVGSDFKAFDDAKTAGASVAGTATANFYGVVVGGNDAGLVTATYTATVVLDGTSYPISIPVTTADTFTTVVAAINADLPGTECAISGGNIVFTSPTTGNASYVTVTDVDIFAGMTGFGNLDTALAGGTGGNLTSVTLTNGANAYTAYSPAIEVYDTAADDVIIDTDAAAPTAYTAHSAGGVTVTSTAATDLDTTAAALATLVTEVTSLTTKVNALQDLVEKEVLHEQV